MKIPVTIECEKLARAVIYRLFRSEEEYDGRPGPPMPHDFSLPQGCDEVGLAQGDGRSFMRVTTQGEATKRVVQSHHPENEISS